jgi:hypothetical protein
MVSVAALTPRMTVPAPTLITAGVCEQPEVLVALQVAALTTATLLALAP